jgi:hypothetical protein
MKIRVFFLILGIIFGNRIPAQEDSTRLFFQKLKEAEVSVLYAGQIRKTPSGQDSLILASIRLDSALGRTLLTLLSRNACYESPEGTMEGTPSCLGNREVFLFQKGRNLFYRLELDVVCRRLYVYEENLLIWKGFPLSDCARELEESIRVLKIP